MSKNTQITAVTFLSVAAIVLVGFSGSRCLADFTGTIWDGSITWDATEEHMVASDGWESTTTKIEWNVVPVSDADSDPYIDNYHYSYTFTVPQYSLSHFILQVSDTFDLWGFPEEDYVNATLDPLGLDALLDTYHGTGNNKPNPGMPGSIYGLKFEGFDENTTWTWSFDSYREPVRGNFFAVDGQHENEWAYAYNSGFSYDPYEWYDEEAGIYNYDFYGYIATPDTTFVPVPTAVLLGLIGMGYAGLKLRKYA